MEEVRKRVLGRGIAALIPGQNAVLQDKQSDGGVDGDISHIAVGIISAGANQPRTEFDQSGIEELAESIRRHGVLQPIIVQPANDGYKIVAGERRWRASVMAGLPTIPCLIKNISNSESAEIALVENIQRQNLSVLDEAQAYIRLIEEFGYSYDDLAQKLGKSRSHIINTVRITKLPLEVQRLLQERKISAGHARAILAHTDPIAAANTIVENNLSVRDAEKMAKTSETTNDNKAVHGRSSRLKRMSSAANNPGSSANWIEGESDLIAIEQMLFNSLGMKVEIKDTLEGGEMVIQFKTVQELDNLVCKLGSGG